VRHENICVAYVANRLLQQLQYYRSFRPGGWRARLLLQGQGHLDEALKQNRGVILWVTPTTSSDLAVRRCLAETGYSISHLSVVHHGLSGSRFGVRWINAPGIAVGNRYLRKRIILDRDEPGPALAEIEERLIANEIVSITAVENEGRKSLEVPLFSARLLLGGGALNFGYKTGATVLPVFCVRDANGYQVRIEPPLHIDRKKERQEATAAALTAFGGRVENFVLQYPEQWYGWARLRTGKPGQPEVSTIWDYWVLKTGTHRARQD
jgi:lauroyl/myristoyl acyltransferase